MSLLETVIILNSKYKGKTTQEEDISKYKDLIQGFSTKKKIKFEKIGERKLAYDIQGCKTGYYILFTYEASPDQVAELERQLRINDRVIKFVTVETDKDPDILGDLVLPTESEQDRPEESKDLFDLIFGIK